MTEKINRIEPKRKVGRPTKYDPAYCDTVIDMGKEGAWLAEFASNFDVSRATIDVWAAEHPEFLEALNRAKSHSQAWWESEVRKGSTKRTHDAALIKLVMQARFADDGYKDMQKHEISGVNGAPINVANTQRVILNLDQMSTEQIEMLRGLPSS